VANIGVVYLYRFAEGAAAVHRFLDSYRRHPAGIEHDLHIILKGFPGEDALASARAIFGSVPFNAIVLNDGGYDIGSYFAAARTVANPQLLFLNTFSEILADNWLAHFDKALATPAVGLVGATGSWQSGSSGYEAAVFRALRRLKRPHNRADKTNQLVAVANGGDTNTVASGRINIRRVLRNLPRMGLYPLRLYEFGRHPNPHIRTNAFMIRRDLFLSLRAATFRRKIDAYKFESGRHSMTKQIIARGLRPLVVDRSGEVYEISEWKSSSTFWIDLQTNLLVADNQTSNYATGSPQRRTILKDHAWESPRAWNMASANE
jgi:hypothetical protein